MAILSQQTFTIRRLIDGKTLNFLLQSNRPRTQIYTPDPATYLPNYTASPFLVITPALVVSGEPNDQIHRLREKPTWKINGSTTLTSFSGTVANTPPYALTIKKNMTDIAQMSIECEGIYVQDVTDVEMEVKATIDFSKTTNSGAMIWAQAWAVPGNTFMNDQEEELEARCELIRGSDSSTANASFQWQRLISGSWTNMNSSNSPDITGYATHTLKVKGKAIVNRERFKCVVTDTKAGSSTQGDTVAAYVEFIDMSDPYVLDVEFLSGDGVKPGEWAKLRFQCRQGATRMASAFFTGKTLKVFRFNAAGELDTSWGSSGYKNPDADRELTITDEDLLTGKAQTAFGVQLEG